MSEKWEGRTLQELHNMAAAAPSGTLLVTIEELNAVQADVEALENVAARQWMGVSITADNIFLNNLTRRVKSRALSALPEHLRGATNEGQVLDGWLLSDGHRAGHG